MLALKGNNGPRQQPHGDRRRGADADFADAGALDRFDVVAGVAQLRFDHLGARQQRLARRGRGDTMSGAAMQQLATPRSSSNCWMLLVTEDCDRLRILAALPTAPASTTAVKLRNWLSFMAMPAGPW